MKKQTLPNVKNSKSLSKNHDFNISELEVLEQLSKQIAEIQSLKKSGSSQEEIIKFISDKITLDSGEIEKGLSCYKFLLENKDVLEKKFVDKTKALKFRQSGHLIDQTLKYVDPKKQQLTFFHLLSTETQHKIEENNIAIKAEGIRLSTSEDKLLKALSKLIYQKNGNKAINSEDSNTDNFSYQITPYGGNEQTARALLLKIQPSELYKAYLDRDVFSGDEIKFIKKLLHDLSQKKFLIIYDRKRQLKGKTVTDRIEDFQNLIRIMSYFEGLSENELERADKGDSVVREKRGEIIIGLNPIFIDQMNTKYIEYPSDINKRTSIAAGGHHSITESMIVLRDYLLREISAGRFRVEINADNLPYILRLDGYLARRKKKLVAERISSAINIVKNLGILSEYEITIGASGQQKYIFMLNKDFE